MPLGSGTALAVIETSARQHRAGRNGRSGLKVSEVAIEPRPLERMGIMLTETERAELLRAVDEARERLADRRVWNVSSTAVGGGVAEMLRPLLSYARGVGVEARWLVIGGDPGFFRVTKRLHNALHGAAGDRTPLGSEERRIYESNLDDNAREILARVRPGDIAILHDPQTAGLAPTLARAGLRVVWRCHIGSDDRNSEVARAWAFLAPYLIEASCFVFSRSAYIPDLLDDRPTVIIQPSIDPFSAKNQALAADTVVAILVHVGILEGPPPERRPTFSREDGSAGRVTHRADLVRMGRAPKAETPLVVQVSRWDTLKDHVGVMRGFASLVEGPQALDAQLVLAGPNVHAVADDPEGHLVFRTVLEAWRGLPHGVRDHVTLASLPSSDIEESAAIVNALQRHASVVVQKSLREGFGLTVTEAMWKEKPVLASATGGIQDQIQDGKSGVLLSDPTDLEGFSAALRDLLEHPDKARAMGLAARERVRERFLGIRHLLQYHALLGSLDGRPE